MQSEIFSILRSLSKKEMFSLGEYLQSPYFNKSKKKLELFEYIRSFYPLFSDMKVDKKTTFEFLYPGKLYNDSTMRNLFSDLHNEVLNFLTIENFKKDESNKYRFLLKELTSKNLNEEWGNTIENLDASCETGADYNYFLNKHLLAGNKFNYNYLNEKISKEKNLEEGLEYVNNSSVNLLYHFVTELSTNYLNTISYLRQFNFNLESNLTNKIMSLLDFNKIKHIIPDENRNKFILNLYLSLIKMFLNIEDENLYFDYKKLFYSNLSNLSREEIALHYNKLIDYCILKVRKSEHGKFSKELFELYNTMILKEYYKNNKTNLLAHQQFRNILLHALRLREFSWADEFINKYSNKVHPHDVENMFNYGQAYLNYYLGKYGESLKHLQLINPEFIFYKFDVKNLTLMVYFELGYHEEALYLIKTYLEFLRKNRVINTERKKRYLNFVKFTEKIILFKFGTSKHDLGYIRHRLTNHNMTAFKPWLMEKISSLEAGFGKAV